MKTMPGCTVEHVISEPGCEAHQRLTVENFKRAARMKESKVVADEGLPG